MNTPDWQLCPTRILVLYSQISAQKQVSLSDTGNPRCCRGGSVEAEPEISKNFAACPFVNWFRRGKTYIVERMSNPALIECDDEQRRKRNTDRMEGIRSHWCFSSRTRDSMFRCGNGFRWGCFIGQKNPAELRFHGNNFLWKVIWEIDVEMRAYVATNVSFQSNSPRLHNV